MAFRLIGNGLPRVILSHIALAKNGLLLENPFAGLNWGVHLPRLSKIVHELVTSSLSILDYLLVEKSGHPSRRLGIDLVYISIDSMGATSTRSIRFKNLKDCILAIEATWQGKISQNHRPVYQQRQIALHPAFCKIGYHCNAKHVIKSKAREGLSGSKCKTFSSWLVPRWIATNERDQNHHNVILLSHKQKGTPIPLIFNTLI